MVEGNGGGAAVWASGPAVDATSTVLVSSAECRRRLRVLSFPEESAIASSIGILVARRAGTTAPTRPRPIATTATATNVAGRGDEPIEPELGQGGDRRVGRSHADDHADDRSHERQRGRLGQDQPEDLSLGGTHRSEETRARDGAR